MGIEEFHFLKKTLSEIESNKTKILHFQRSKKKMKQKISTLEGSISEEKKAFRILDERRQHSQKMGESLNNLGDDTQKLHTLKIELKQIEDENEGKYRTTKAWAQSQNSTGVQGFSILVVLSYLFLVFGAQVIFGDGWMTLLFDSEGDLEFECENGEILPFYYVNDGDDDCGDNSDENVQVTPELSDRIARSDTDSWYAFGFGCCLLPLILVFLSITISNLDANSKLMDEGTKTKLRVLRGQITKMEKKIARPGEIKSQRKNLEKQLEESRTSLVRLETRLEKANEERESKEIEIEKIEKNTSKLYESIKHLIPYSNQLKVEKKNQKT